MMAATQEMIASPSHMLERIVSLINCWSGTRTLFVISCFLSEWQIALASSLYPQSSKNFKQCFDCVHCDYFRLKSCHCLSLCRSFSDALWCFSTTHEWYSPSSANALHQKGRLNVCSVVLLHSQYPAVAKRNSVTRQTVLQTVLRLTYCLLYSLLCYIVFMLQCTHSVSTFMFMCIFWMTLTCPYDID